MFNFTINYCNYFDETKKITMVTVIESTFAIFKAYWNFNSGARRVKDYKICAFS